MLETSKPSSVPRSAPPYSSGGSDLMRGRYGNWSADGPTSTSSSDSQAPKVSLCVICHLEFRPFCCRVCVDPGKVYKVEMGKSSIFGRTLGLALVLRTQYTHNLFTLKPEFSTFIWPSRADNIRPNLRMKFGIRFGVIMALSAHLYWKVL